MTDLTGKIQKLRDTKGWTQEHLARASGLSLRTIQRLEAGKGVSKETIMSVGASLEVSPAEIIGQNSLGKFRVIVVSLLVMLAVIMATGWILYTQEFSVQTQYVLNYRIFLAISSLITGIIWGSACAWLIHTQGKPARGLATWLAGLLILFVLYNLLPIVQWPNDQYSAAFQWIVTGLGSATFSLVLFTWLWGDFKNFLKKVISEASGSAQN